ncbi:hypothetical protein CKO31_22955 [Thiohalocapsa halophila]|uniref:PD-(D/E)XK endonuclease-like domain-containing protein n=1 Tax=Thiohalocapsa halophila TaxID=69359 RepID=A0ABS1CQB5_9GAMM|nr:hypothetical protein [Thiohalocapsa halophila]MBK1633551.1 hypothetical protein [Thiohalocapsa halophila]
MHITNHANLPAAIVEAVKRDPYNPGDCDISVTRLIGPPQIRILERLHDDDIEEDAADRLWALYGQIVHAILERAAVKTHDIAERRLFAAVEGWRVSGQFDNLILWPDGTLQDYKLTSVWAVADGVKPEWIAQLNVLRWLLHRNGYPPVRRLENVAMLRDWSKPKSRREPDYPPKGAKVLPCPLWSLAETEQYLIERVRLHQEAERCAAAGEPLPACTDAERWARPTTWAVKKPGRKSALPGGLHDTEQAAREHAATVPSGYVETRHGESVRCAEYCAVVPWCAQRQAEIAQRQAEAA